MRRGKERRGKDRDMDRDSVKGEGEEKGGKDRDSER